MDFINDLKRYSINDLYTINKNAGGVYFLFNNETLVYIGRSVVLKTRIGNHKKDKIFTAFSFIEMWSTYYSDFLESALIRKYKPTLNISLKDKDYDLNTDNEIFRLLNDPFYDTSILTDKLQSLILK